MGEKYLLTLPNAQLLFRELEMHRKPGVEDVASPGQATRPLPSHTCSGAQWIDTQGNYPCPSWRSHLRTKSLDATQCCPYQSLRASSGLDIFEIKSGAPRQRGCIFHSVIIRSRIYRYYICVLSMVDAIVDKFHISPAHQNALFYTSGHVPS